MAATCLNGGQILETQDGVTMFYLYFLGWFGCNLPLILEIMERRQSDISNKYLFTLKTLEIERYTLFKLVLVVVMKIPSKTIAFYCLVAFFTYSWFNFQAPEGFNSNPFQE